MSSLTNTSPRITPRGNDLVQIAAWLKVPAVALRVILLITSVGRVHSSTSPGRMSSRLNAKASLNRTGLFPRRCLLNHLSRMRTKRLLPLAAQCTAHQSNSQTFNLANVSQKRQTTVTAGFVAWASVPG